jgi:hypothetical protein
MKTGRDTTRATLIGKRKKSKKLTYHPLPDDPRKALLQISKFLNTVVMKKRRFFPTRADGNHFKGFWQTIRWTYRLQEIAYEAERVAKLL